jgi:hypothetical protein
MQTIIDQTNYHLNTQANFRHVYAGVELTTSTRSVILDMPEAKWAELCAAYPDKVKTSPKSDSQYIVLNDRVYRYADHWGRCASCWWDCIVKTDELPENFVWGKWSIGVAYYNEFQNAE